MNEVQQAIQLYAGAYAQLASISAVLGGLAFAAAAAILSAGASSKDPNALGRAAKVTIATAMAATVCLLVAALTWSLMSADLSRIAANPSESLARQVINVNWVASFVFLAGVLLFFSSIGSSGWIGSRKLGILTSVMGLAGAIIYLILFAWSAN